MNERIKELVDQVNIPHRPGDNCRMISDQELEKFAELIIRRCIFEACNDFGYGGQFYEGAKFAADEIREYFGIKE